MDCKEFNDYLTEYEARKLSKSKEAEFLEHKNTCSECSEIFDLVINHDDLCNFDELTVEENNVNNIVREIVMDKISNMEYTGYNFKKSNILNVTFGSIFIGLMAVVAIESNKNLFLQISNSLQNGMEKLAFVFENGSVLLSNAYVKNVWYLVLIFIVSAFSISVFEYRRLKNDETKLKTSQN